MAVDQTLNRERWVKYVGREKTNLVSQRSLNCSLCVPRSVACFPSIQATLRETIFIKRLTVLKHMNFDM